MLKVWSIGDSVIDEQGRPDEAGCARSCIALAIAPAPAELGVDRHHPCCVRWTFDVAQSGGLTSGCSLHSRVLYGVMSGCGPAIYGLLCSLLAGFLASGSGRSYCTAATFVASLAADEWRPGRAQCARDTGD